MNVQTVDVNGMSISIPEYYVKVESSPEDPENSVPFMTESPNARCLVLIYPITPDKRIPTNQWRMLEGIRMYLTESQGVIEIGQGVNSVYSIVKTRLNSGVIQYSLTFQKIYSETDTLTVQAFFSEIGTTGLRESIVYEYCRREKIVGTDEDPFFGWSRDPYDES